MFATRLIASSVRNFSTGGGACFKSNNVAVVLSGCGVYDGSEVHEATSCLAAITRHGLTPVVYAPDKNQAHVVDHQVGEASDAQRSVLSESARISRCAVKSLSVLKQDDAMALVIPGGFGAAKNLSDFGFKGTDMTVDPEVERVLTDFKSAGKPIALCCIAPILAAKVFGDKGGVTLTLGMKGDADAWPYGGAVDAARSLGANVVEATVADVVVDPDTKVITTPAYMYNGQYHEIQDGVKNMIDAMVEVSKQ